MKKITVIASGIAAVSLIFGAIQARSQSVTFDFSDGTADGWANTGFNGGPPLGTVSSISGNNYLYIPFVGFQSGNVASGYAGNLPTFTATMAAALNNPAGYTISYDYYIDTSTFSGVTFLQLGTFLNAGSGYYSQDYSTPNQVQLNGTQTASGQVFSGHVSVNIGAVFGNDASAGTENFFRLGLIENGNGTGVGAYFDNITVAPIPEPSTLALIGLGAVATMLMLRRRLA